MRLRVGVAISTYRRPHILARALAQWALYTPDVLVVNHDVDGDGVAATKNRGIAVLMDAGCEHLFLADDDMWPIAADWAGPYVDDPEPHLMHCWGERRLLFDDGHYRAFSHPRGVLLYAERRVIEAVGGMRLEFGKWGGEHVEWSRRIHNAGLTTLRYADLSIAKEGLWHAEDYTRSTPSTVTTSERRAGKRRQHHLFGAYDSSTDYIPYGGLRVHDPSVLPLVWLHGPDGCDDCELRWSIRSLTKNLPHSQVWVVGYAPPWVDRDTVNVIDVPSSGRPKGWQKHHQLNEAMLAACDKIPGGFVVCHDDEFATRPADPLDVCHQGGLAWRTEQREKRNNRHGWTRCHRATLDHLTALGRDRDTLLTYELHRPFPVTDPGLMAGALRAAPQHPDIPVFQRTLYGNLAGIGGGRSGDHKAGDVDRDLPDQTWVSTSNDAFTQGRLGAALRAMFRDPSPYERRDHPPAPMPEQQWRDERPARGSGGRPVFRFGPFPVTRGPGAADQHPLRRARDGHRSVPLPPGRAGTPRGEEREVRGGTATSPR